ncbi:hypothetical protein [Sorangium cellulosum]|uniref:hypothetical protein n=1 Tax=Sorangium cellulosum TaxID=56 RepID=UPI0005D1392C|nr:hypothetical protein [Sorangium cellulosum]
MTAAATLPAGTAGGGIGAGGRALGVFACAVTRSGSVVSCCRNDGTPGAGGSGGMAFAVGAGSGAAGGG